MSQVKCRKRRTTFKDFRKKYSWTGNVTSVTGLRLWSL